MLGVTYFRGFKNYSRFGDERLQEVARYVQNQAPAGMVESCIDLARSNEG